MYFFHISLPWKEVLSLRMFVGTFHTIRCVGGVFSSQGREENGVWRFFKSEEIFFRGVENSQGKLLSEFMIGISGIGLDGFFVVV